MRPPKLLKPYVIAFARQATRDSNAAPFYVRCSPVQGMANECFPIVEEHVSRHGGSCVLGWAIWERPKAFIEAEFHAIWRAPDGRYIDIAPRDFPIQRVLFVQDQRRKYAGTPVDNVRKSLAKDKEIERFLHLQNEYFLLINEGELKYQFEVPVTPKMLANRKEAIALQQKLNSRYGPWLPEGSI